MPGGYTAEVGFRHRAPQGLSGRVLTKYLSIDPAEALFSKRGFSPTRAQPLLEVKGVAFISGYNFVLADPEPRTLIRYIGERLAPERGFVAEGAAMAAAVRAALMPWRNELDPVLRALTHSYVHLAHVGVGWALARLPFARRRLMRKLDARLAPLALDGRGFHDGYFLKSGESSVRRPAGEWGRIYDQGVGRSLWFSSGADPARLAAAVSRKEPARRDDFWAGIGLACVYAGGADLDGIDRLAEAAGTSSAWFRQGAAFAIAAHARAGAVPEQSAADAWHICGREAASLTAIVNDTFGDGAVAQPAAYQKWRYRVAAALVNRTR